MCIVAQGTPFAEASSAIIDTAVTNSATNATSVNDPLSCGCRADNHEKPPYLSGSCGLCRQASETLRRLRILLKSTPHSSLRPVHPEDKSSVAAGIFLNSTRRDQLTEQFSDLSKYTLKPVLICRTCRESGTYVLKKPLTSQARLSVQLHQTSPRSHKDVRQALIALLHHLLMVLSQAGLDQTLQEALSSSDEIVENNVVFSSVPNYFSSACTERLPHEDKNFLGERTGLHNDDTDKDNDDDNVDTSEYSSDVPSKQLGQVCFADAVSNETFSFRCQSTALSLETRSPFDLTAEISNSPSLALDAEVGLNVKDGDSSFFGKDLLDAQPRTLANLFPCTEDGSIDVSALPEQWKHSRIMRLVSVNPEFAENLKISKVAEGLLRELQNLNDADAIE